MEFLRIKASICICIDQLTDELLSAGRKLQFIITSHHPYIINSIGFKHWKLVTRKAGVVKTLEPDSLNLGKSKHDAFANHSGSCKKGNFFQPNHLGFEKKIKARNEYWSRIKASFY